MRKLFIPKLWLNIISFFRWIRFKTFPKRIGYLDDKYLIPKYKFQPGLPWGKIKDTPYWRYDPPKETHNYYEAPMHTQKGFIFPTYYSGIEDKWINGATHTTNLYGHGIYEFKARVPIVDGLNPAVWIYFLDGDKETYYEIDVIETFDAKLQSTVHFKRKNEDRYALPFKMSIEEKTYKYTLNYQADRIEFYLDGAMYYKIDFKPAMKSREGYIIINNSAHEPDKLNKKDTYLLEVEYVKYKPCTN